MIRVFFVFALSTSAAAQSLSIGAVAGTNLTNDVQAGRDSIETVFPGTRRPILGVSFDLSLATNTAIEFQALHRELKTTSTIGAFGPFTRTLTTWELPLLFKYTLSGRSVKPFFTAGPSFRPAGNGTGLSHTGITTGAGIAIHLPGGFRISPELRYTRWSYRPIGYTLGAPLLHQVELFVTIDRPSTNRRFSVFRQPVSFGAIAGLDLGDDFIPGIFPNHIPESNSPLFGVLAEIQLPRSLSLEVNATYRPLHGTAPEGSSRVRFAHLTWEFPILLKHRLTTHHRITPFLEAGPSFRAEGNLNLRPVSHYGATAGAGLEFRWRPIKIAPTARYTRWAGTSPPAVSHTAPNQFQILVAIAF
ncbi:MAG: hypothetical protein JST93_04705 [Acidobacteria bacterium]|nr:hypothetical protein [Acidobacteriota bacterium]